MQQELKALAFQSGGDSECLEEKARRMDLGIYRHNTNSTFLLELFLPLRVGVTFLCLSVSISVVSVLTDDLSKEYEPNLLT